MNTRKHYPNLLVVALLLASTAASAQDLRLFEEIEADPVNQTEARPQMQPTNTSAQPAFTLKGLSRFGDVYKVMLVNRSGQVARLNWQPGQQSELEGFSGFTVVAADAGGVTLQQPPEDSCLPMDTLGVSCTSATMATLQLAPAAALAVNGSAPQPPVAFGGRSGQPEPATLVDANGQQVFINPFSGQPETVQPLSEEERQQREARQRERAARLGAFEVQRIAPEDVRPGMRVVRTPFGDREVPIRE